ncbi:MAG: metal ABC transporter permease [Chlamydiia bacterium]|nr:metal ABC transporter permease [Chlamydiia bacterium]
MSSPLSEYLFDPVLRGPLWGSLFMCIASALIGVIVVLRKQSLTGEMVSHASFPGVFAGIALIANVEGIESNDWLLSLTVLFGALITSLLGMWTTNFLVNRLKIHGDSALCFVLSLFFGVGILIASRLQFSHTLLYLRGQSYLFGQAATLTDAHIWIYFALGSSVALIIALFFKEIQLLLFDRQFAQMVGIRINLLESMLSVLIVVAVIIGLRAVGVVLMAAMLIAPAICARQWTHSLRHMFLLAAAVGGASAFFGVYLSAVCSRWLTALYPEAQLSFPTGPMIVLVASTMTILSLFISPQNGWCVRHIRLMRFRGKCAEENILKALWKRAESISCAELASDQPISSLHLKWIIRRLVQQGFISWKNQNQLALTPDGESRASRIVRLHRLWELYLAQYLGIGADRVHKSAEEMEHIITPDLEAQLTHLLNNPQVDPHAQPIPPKWSL